MKKVTSVTLFSDAVGMRISMTYSKIDDETGTIIADNIRLDRVVTDKTAQTNGESIMDYAQTFVDTVED